MTELILLIFSKYNFSPQWAVVAMTSAGGVLSTFGVMRQSTPSRFLGWLLQFFSFYVFIGLVWYPFTGSLFRNYYFLSCVLVSATALLSAYMVEKHLIGRKNLWDWCICLSLCVLSVFAWYVGGMREVFAHIVLAERLSGILLVVAATSILAGLLGDNVDWKLFNVLLLLQLPVMAALLFYQTLSDARGYSLLSGWGTTVWPITFFVQYRILGVIDDLGWGATGRIYHLISLWLLYYFCLRELALCPILQGGHWLASPIIGQSIFTFLLMLAIVVMKRFMVWPVRSFPSAYLYLATFGIVLIFTLSQVISIT